MPVGTMPVGTICSHHALLRELGRERGTNRARLVSFSHRKAPPLLCLTLRGWETCSRHTPGAIRDRYRKRASTRPRFHRHVLEAAGLRMEPA